MAITLKKRERETNERLLRRFSRRIQTSGVLLRAKKRQYFEKPKNDNRVKKDALRRMKIRERNEYLKRIGVLDEETMFGPPAKGAKRKK